MSSTTKPTPIDAESIKREESLDTTSDLYRKFSDYERQEKSETEYKKNKIAREIELMGETYISEIEVKHQEIENDRLDMIEFIIFKTNDKLIKPKKLYDMTHEEVKSIYLKAQDYDKSWVRIVLEFMMGW